jgi:general secretion pathway protein G
MKAMHKIQPAQAQHGFTLLELLVVVSILAAVAGIATSAVGGYHERAREELVHVEMNNIADAIYKFQTDTGYFPKTGVYPDSNTSLSDRSDLGFLFKKPDVGQVWSPENPIGWNGPYMQQSSSQRLHNGGDCDNTGNVVAIVNSVIALEDPFENSIDFEANPTTCFAIHDDGNWIAKKYSGQAFQYITDFTNSEYPDCDSNNCVVLLSAGKDGKFDSGNSDDLVKVLRVN